MIAKLVTAPVAPGSPPPAVRDDYGASDVRGGHHTLCSIEHPGATSERGVWGERAPRVPDCGDRLPNLSVSSWTTLRLPPKVGDVSRAR